MKKRIVAILCFALFWLVVFIIARLFFILTHTGEAAQYPLSSMAATFLHGLKLDISATGYILAIPVLLLILTVFFTGKWYGDFMKWYTYIIVVISSIIIVTDTLLYKYWGFRMDHTVFFYLKTPKEAMASATALQTTAVVMIIIAISAVFILLYRKLVYKLFFNFSPVKLKIPATLFLTLCFASLLIPVRGGVGIAPINAGTVYFSKHKLINHTAVNVVWNVGDSFFNGKPTKNPYVFFDHKKAVMLTDSLTKRPAGSVVKVINQPRPNIIILVLESFGSALIGPLGGDSLTTPNLNRYCNEGLLFTDFYASGNRTDKAMPAILNGYPAQPAQSVMKEPKKTQSLPGIVKKLSSEGYKTSFWYGGEINFANFNSFIINNGFHEVVTMDNFDPRFYNSKWGVHDHIFLNTLSDSMRNIREPFFKVVLTLSSHEPFDVPMEPVFEGNDDLTRFRNSVFYSDTAVGAFIEKARESEWWDNTLMIIIADHCRRNSDDVLVYSEDMFRIPMLWLGGALDTADVRIEKKGSQTDIALTLLNQLEINADFPFAKDLLSENSPSFAFYTFNDGFAFITDSSKYIYDNKLNNAVLSEGKDPETAAGFGKAYLQVLYEDFLGR